MKGIFQLVVVIIFIVGAVFGVLVFSGAIPLGGDDSQATGTVVLWGTIPSGIVAPILEEFNDANETFIVQYVEKAPETFDADLLEALATGTGPDMIFLPDTLTFHYANKIFIIPYQSYPLVNFRQTFAGAGDVFLTSTGVLAFPLTIDPLVMYYNATMLDANGIVKPPTTWSEVSNTVPLLTKKDDSNRLIKSGVALGHFSNITHAKDILSALFMQAGNPIVSREEELFYSALASGTSAYDLGSVLQFYTSFTDPAQNVYSWNKSFTNSTDAFSAENLALYFGFASELQSLVNRNPNHNFQVAPFPQTGAVSAKLTSSRVTGVAIMASSKNLPTAFTAASLMATTDFAAKFAAALGIPPARRDLLAVKPIDAYFPIFYDGALYARTWLDPSPRNTNDIFRTMIDQTLSNNLSSQDAIDDASAKLDLLLRGAR